MRGRYVPSAVPLVIVAALLLGCGDDPGLPTLVSVHVEILESDAPASVDVTAVAIEEGAANLASHGVVVTWQGDGPVVLGDSKFFHAVPAVAGRSCYVGWDEERNRLAGGCNDDLVLTEVLPGAQHEYPVTLLLSAGDNTYRLDPGAHTIHEPVEWWNGSLDDWRAAASDGPAPPPDGRFTVRLTYTVE